MTTRLNVTVTDRRTERVVVRAEREFQTRTSFTDALDFAHRAADGVVPRADRHVSVHRVAA
jgi:hypothetical protein